MPKEDEIIKIGLALGAIWLLSKVNTRASASIQSSAMPTNTMSVVKESGSTSYSKEVISYIQSSLDMLLGANAVIDGIYGPQTANLISTYQSLRGLPDTGKPDDATLSSIQNDLIGGNIYQSPLDYFS